MEEQKEGPKKAKKSRRGRGEGSIYLRKSDGRYVSSFIVEETGKRKYLYGETRAEVRAKLQQAQLEQKQGILATGPQQKFETYLLQWFEQVHKPTLRLSSIERYESCIRKHILPGLGHIQVQKLTAQQIQSFYNQKRRGENGSKGLGAESIKTMHKLIHKALDNAVKWRLVSRNVSDDVTLPKTQSERESQALTVEQTRRLLEAVKGHELEAMIVLFLNTSIRHGEATALRWDDVDLEKRVMRVRRTETRLIKYGHVVGEAKTQAGVRVITLSVSAAAVLQQHRLRQEDAKQKAGSQWKNLNLVFTNSKGGYMDKPEIRKKFYSLLESIGLPQIRIHDLRHTATTLLIEMGVNQKAVQERTGHANLSMTMKYTHVSDAMQQEIASRLDTLLWRPESEK